MILPSSIKGLRIQVKHAQAELFDTPRGEERAVFTTTRQSVGEFGACR
jgi:hypothetical protein